MEAPESVLRMEWRNIYKEERHIKEGEREGTIRCKDIAHMLS
jgi:hypothetical protein